MTFIVDRVSLWGAGCPCEESKQMILFDGISKKEKKFWTIEVNSLEELMDFKNKYGDIILQDSINVKGWSEVLIYDGYIE